MKPTGGRMSRAERANRKDNEAYRQAYRVHEETGGSVLSWLLCKASSETDFSTSDTQNLPLSIEQSFL